MFGRGNSFRACSSRFSQFGRSGLTRSSFSAKTSTAAPTTLWGRSVLSSVPIHRSKHEISIPDWHHFKKDEPAESYNSRAFSYFMIGSASFGYALSAKHIVRELLDTMNPAANVRALANIEVDLSNVAEGASITLKWRGKPLFIRHRTEPEIQAALDTNLSELRDPQPDTARRKENKPEWLIVIGVCTHLGCVPLTGQGDYGGWFCPCHGSHYDTSGRIRKGPAPQNLLVPPFVFVDDTTVLVGKYTLD